MDDVLRQGVQGISDLITLHGIINVDFADVKAIMQDAGSALMGIGRGTGDNRAIEAARSAIESPLLELSIDGAKGILFNITGGTDLGMYEIDEAAKAITEAADPDANIIFGAIIDEAMQGEVKITVIATGFEGDAGKRERRFGTINTQAMHPAQQPQMPQMQPQQQMMPQQTSAYPTYEPPMAPSMPQRTSIPTYEPPVEKEEEELDVPTFIRRKLK